MAWVPPAALQHQIDDGMFSIVPGWKVPWDRIWELADESVLYSNSLEERIADVRKREEGNENGTIEVSKERAARMAKRASEVWELVVSETDAATLQGSEWEQQLADEALVEWCKVYTSGLKPPVR